MVVIPGVSNAATAKNLVSNATYSVLSATGTYGSDALGDYYEVASSGQHLYLNISVESPSLSGNFTYMFAYTRRSAAPDWSGLCIFENSGGGQILGLQRVSNETNLRIWQNGSNGTTLSYNVATGPAVDTEHAIVVVGNGTTTKLFYTGGGSPVSVSQGALTAETNTYVVLGGMSSGEWHPCRARALARWTRALSDADAQALANTPQDIMGTAPPASSDTQRLGRGLGRGIARGMARQALNWIRTPSGLLVPA